MNVARDYCISSYLALRYVAKPDAAWAPGVTPAFPNRSAQGKVKVKTAAEVLDGLRESMRESGQKPGLGVLLSAGMDSAIIAALLPRGTRAYTVRFVATDAIDE